MSGELRAPEDRECERCGRRETWDGDAGTWRVPDDAVGDPFCIHEWDINGSFTPFDR